MVCSPSPVSPFFLFLFFSQVNTRSDTSEVRKSKESRLILRPPSLRSIKPSVSFVYLGRQVTQFCRNVLLSNDSAVLERYRAWGEDTRVNSTRQIRTRFTTTIVTLYHDCELLRLRDFDPVTCDGDMTLVKGAVTSRRCIHRAGDAYDDR